MPYTKTIVCLANSRNLLDGAWLERNGTVRDWVRGAVPSVRATEANSAQNDGTAKPGAIRSCAT
jgi:hypothetical protein